MPLYVCCTSALAHYRCALVPAEPSEEADAFLDLPNALFQAIDLVHTSLAGLGIDEPTSDCPLHIMIPQVNQRPQTPAFTGHVCSKHLPAGSLRRVNSEVYVCSPELTFVQLARWLELPELIALGMELCGTYRREVIGAAAPGYDQPKTLYEMPQLTTVDKLKAFVNSAKTLPGVKRARAALQHIRDFSASPFETIIYLLLCLPRRMGGYALPTPELNPPITFSKRGRTFTVRSGAYGDLFWRKAKIDLEYDGETHDYSRTEDSMRRKALERMNIEVIGLTYDEVCSVDLFHATALRIARALGTRARVEGDFPRRRDELRKLLLKTTAAVAKRSSISTNMQIEAIEGEVVDEIPADFERRFGGWDEDSWITESDDYQTEWNDRDYSEWDGIDEISSDWDGWMIDMPILTGDSQSEQHLSDALAELMHG